MLLADRSQFEDQLGALCAGFNVPMTELRTEAYWRGLQKMQLGQFARMVEFALGEGGPERIPTVPQCWNLWKQARNRKPASAPREAQSAPAFDSFHSFGNRCLLRYLTATGGVPDDMLPRLVAEKNRLAADFRAVASECEITAEEVRSAMLAGFAEVAGTRVHHA